MIRELSVRPKPTNNNAKIIFYVSLAVSALGAIAYLVLRALGVEKSGLLGFIPLVGIIVTVFFYNKYISGTFSYDVTFDSEGYAIFVVRQTVGKRSSTLCRIGLSEIYSVKRESAEERRSHKTPTDHRRYVYLPTLIPDVSYRITTRSRYERSEILIECSEEFAELLSSYAA